MDLANTLAAIQKLAVDAATPKVVHVQSDPVHVNYLSVEGEVKRVVSPSAIRQHQAADIESLVESLVKSSSEAIDGDLPATAPRAAIWYSVNGIVGYLDESLRRDHVTIPMGLSPQMQTMQDLSEQSPARAFSQMELIRFLKNDLYGCLARSGGLLDNIRRVKFILNKQATGVQTTSKASYGNSIEAELTGADKLPEFVEFQVPVFANPRVQFIASIACSFDCDLDNGLFMLKPTPMSVEVAIAEAEIETGARIKKYASDHNILDDRLLIFAGHP
jgi:hypothetical protein